MIRTLYICGFILVLCINMLSAQEAESNVAQAEAETASDGTDVLPDESMEDILPGFRNQALVLYINARVIDQNMLEIWNEVHQRVTIPGRPVGIKMVGSNIIVAAQFIPYLRRRGQNILVAQVQIWIDIPNQGLRYQTTMQTIPLAFNEPVYFFPLGSDTQPDETKIEIILTMQQYADSMKTEAATEQAADNSKQ